MFNEELSIIIKKYYKIIISNVITLQNTIWDRFRGNKSSTLNRSCVSEILHDVFRISDETDRMHNTRAATNMQPE